MPFFSALGPDPLVAAAGWFAIAVAALAFRALARRSALGRRLDSSFVLVIIGLLVGGAAAILRATGPAAAMPYVDALVLGALALGAARAALTLFVDRYLRAQRGLPFSSIFLDVASTVAYFVVIFAVLHATLNINVASLIATSAVLTAIVGLALQDVLSNLFSGLVLELEQSFAPGDWVRVGGFEGMIVETRWRTTKIRTRVNELVTLPNAVLSKEAVVNYSRPDPHFGDVLRFEAAYEAPPNVVKDAVLDVVDAEPEVLRQPRPDVRLERFGESGVGYAIVYWISDFGQLQQIRNRLMTNLWYALRRANVRIPFPARDLFVYPGTQVQLAEPAPDLLTTLRGVALLAPLDDAALQRLATGVQRAAFGKDEVVVREGDVGDCFYVIERGHASVTLENGQHSRSLGHLYPGSVFGEMSVLTGEPRAATVRAGSDLQLLVISRDAFREVIADNPALIRPLSDIAARRQVALDEQRRLAKPRPVMDEPDGQQAQGLHDRIKGFFKL